MNTSSIDELATSQHVGWRWRAIQCLGALLTAASLILGFLPTRDPIALSASAGSDLLVLNQYDKILRYDGRTGAFKKSLASSTNSYPQPNTRQLHYEPIYRMTIGPDHKIYALAYAGLANQPFTFHILRFDAATGALLDSFISNDTQPPAGQLYSPRGLKFGPDGNLYVNDYNQITRYDGKTGAFAGVVVSRNGPYPPPGVPRLQATIGMAFGPDQKLYVYNARYDYQVCCKYTNSVLRYDLASGAFLGQLVAPTEAPFPAYYNDSSNIIFGPDGNLYLIGMAPNQVLRYDGTTGAPLGVFVNRASAYPDPNDTRTPEPGGMAFGPDGNLYISSPYSNQIRRYNGTTGAFIDVFIDGNRLDFPIDLLFTNAVSANRSTRAAQITVAQQTQPRLQAAPGDLVTTTLVAHNRGVGGAKTATLTMPFDPASVAVVDANFSRPSAWVSRVLSDALEIQLGGLGHDTIVTGTVRLRVLPGAPAGATLAPCLSVNWVDATGSGSSTSNQPAIVVGASTLDAPFALVDVVPASGAAGTARAVQSTGFLPGEPVALWYNTPDGRVVAVGRVTADSTGAIQSAISTGDLPPGFYSVVAHGTWSAITAVGAWQIV